MQLNVTKVRPERLNRAWSQEQLAALTGLGLRTVIRIEKQGVASHESIQAPACVLKMPLRELLVGITAGQPFS